MITFFKRIRKKLIEEDNVRKYLLYAIGEILLVVVGILIALQVNNCNEERIAQNISDETITNLRQELIEAKAKLEQTIPFNERILDESEMYLNDSLNMDSLDISAGRVFYFTNFAPVTLEMPILQRELTSDNLIIEKQDIKEKLREITEAQQMSMEVKRLLNNFWDNQVTPYYVKTETMVDANRFFSGKEYDKEAAKSLLSDSEFKNIVAMTNLGLVQFVNIYKNIIQLMDDSILLND